MKYNVGDKVKIREDLITRRPYGNNTYVNAMKNVAKDHDYILTIAGVVCDKEYIMRECDGLYHWTEEMIEGLAESTDREKFEECMRKLSSLSSLSPYNDVWKAFNYCMDYSSDDPDYDNNLKIVSDYLFGAEKKKITQAEIEAALGYKIEIVKE